MPNIRLPDKHLINAVIDSGQIGQAPIVDWMGNPISAKDVREELREAEPKNNFRFLMPVGNGWRYYKVKNPQNDQWFVGYVKDRRIPRGSIAIAPKTAFEMMYGIKVANSNEAQRNWAKIDEKQQGYVNVNVKEKPQIQFANMNDSSTEEKVIQSAKIIKND